jgi:hypothetical protein
MPYDGGFSPSWGTLVASSSRGTSSMASLPRRHGDASGRRSTRHRRPPAARGDPAHRAHRRVELDGSNVIRAPPRRDRRTVDPGVISPQAGDDEHGSLEALTRRHPRFSPVSLIASVTSWTRPGPTGRCHPRRGRNGDGGPRCSDRVRPSMDSVQVFPATTASSIRVNASSSVTACHLPGLLGPA